MLPFFPIIKFRAWCFSYDSVTFPTFCKKNFLLNTRHSLVGSKGTCTRDMLFLNKGISLNGFTCLSLIVLPYKNQSDFYMTWV